MDRVKQALTAFGLSENEIAVYVEALKHDETSPFALAKATKIPRTTVYDILMSLSLKGLVELQRSEGFEKQQTKIRAENPSVLRGILRERQKELVRTEVDILEILPLLKKDFQGEKANADFRFYPGIDGVKRVYFHKPESSLPKMVWENLMPMDVFGSEEMNKYTDRETVVNQDGGVDHREIIPVTDWTKHVLTYQFGRDPNYIVARKMRSIENPIFKNNLSITLQGTRIYVSCAYADEVWGLLINSKTLFETMSSMFELMWQVAIPITLQVVKSWGENEFLKQEREKEKS